MAALACYRPHVFGPEPYISDTNTHLHYTNIFRERYIYIHNIHRPIHIYMYVCMSVPRTRAPQKQRPPSLHSRAGREGILPAVQRRQVTRRRGPRGAGEQSQEPQKRATQKPLGLQLPQKIAPIHSSWLITDAPGSPSRSTLQ